MSSFLKDLGTIQAIAERRDGYLACKSVGSCFGRAELASEDIKLVVAETRGKL